MQSISVEKGISLIDYLADCMKCSYISNLHYLSKKDRKLLSEIINDVNPLVFSVVEWIDAVEYLSGRRIISNSQVYLQTELQRFLRTDRI